ncbi:FAD-dependent oxidoreductase [Aquabacterium sp.]|uniref:FAD-dependent oxidoreductase n=1 Tax=Aquabacterium sp. TaxID=1872578 RepID=UPI0035B4129A
MVQDNEKLSRRGFMKGAAVATGTAVGAAALAVPLSRHPVLDAEYPEVPENKVELPPNGKSVLIVGGGLSGLQAGVELSARGFKVIILERSGTPGGKLKSWRDRHFGPADDPAKQDPAFPGYIREHGIHAVWGFYNNLREFIGRHGWRLADMPADASIYNFLDKDGTESHLRNCSWPKPYDKIQLLLNAREVKHLPESERNDFVRLAVRLMSFNYADPKQRAYMDSMSFLDYGRKLGVSETLIHKICDSLLEMAYFDNVDKVSALTLANIFQLVAGSADDMKVNLYMNPVGETFVQPMVDYIRAHGGEIHYNTEVTGFEKQGNRIARVLAGEVSSSSGKVRRCSVCGNLIFEGMEAGHECPFCGAHADMLHDLGDDERRPRAWSADYYISALDIPGAQRLVGANLQTLGEVPYFKNILDLHPKSVYVTNLWFDGKGYWERKIRDADGRPAVCFFATGFQHLGITINRSLRVPFPDHKLMAWSTEFPDRDVTVIETQIAKTDQVSGLSTDEIAGLCYQELKAVIPDLPPPRGAYVNRWHTYTGYHVGDEQRRPPVQSPIDNLLFIGDLSFVPHPAVFMEKTNVTAKWATNLILEKAGIQNGRITILMSGTPSVVTDLMQATTRVQI